jgi:ferrous iron transport protein B
VVSNSWAFLSKAGTTIFCLSVVLWAMAYYPRLPEAKEQQLRTAVVGTHDSAARADADKEPDRTAPLTDAEWKKLVDEDSEKAVAGAQSEYSIAGRIGHAMEPVIRPLGFDWKMGVGLVGAFAAREVFVSTMGIVYSVGEVEGDTKSLSDAMRQDRYANGKPVWTPLVAVSLLVWFVLAMQCMSTLAIVRRETGGWAWPAFMVLYMNGLAYVACLAVFQVGRVMMHA